MCVKAILKGNIVMTTSHRRPYPQFNITIEHGLKCTIPNMLMEAQRKISVRTTFMVRTLRRLVHLSQLIYLQEECSL